MHGIVLHCIFCIDFEILLGSEGAYRRYASIVPSSLTVMKNKQTKSYETAATVMIDQRGLQKYLEESGVIKGFSNLW